jgi:hypothetical protein
VHFYGEVKGLIIPIRSQSEYFKLTIIMGDVRVDPTVLHESLSGVRVIGMRPERWRTMLVQDEARRNSGGGSKRC